LLWQKVGEWIRLAIFIVSRFDYLDMAELGDGDALTSGPEYLLDEARREHQGDDPETYGSNGNDTAPTLAQNVAQGEAKIDCDYGKCFRQFHVIHYNEIIFKLSGLDVTHGS
jgi:hypothetical protein